MSQHHQSDQRTKRRAGAVLGGIAAALAGVGLAGATVAGVVQSQQSAGEKPISATNVSYGDNN